MGGITSPKDGGSAFSGPSDDMITLRHLRAGVGDCVGRSIARWSSFMHVSVYLEAEPPCQFPVFQTTHFGALALVRLLFHELLGPWTSTATATAMDLYRRARGVLPSVFTFIRTVDQIKKKKSKLSSICSDFCGLAMRYAR